jgi:hypothetical protein
LQPDVVNATADPLYIYGEPEVAVNPRNPNNLVYVATKIGDTPTCIMSGNPNCQTIPTLFGPQPAGLINNVLDFPTSAGFSPNGINVSFDRGRTWKSVTVPTIPPPFPDTGPLMGGDPAITVTPNGTFVFSEDVVNFTTALPTPPPSGSIARDAGIAVSVSTDGGQTWSTPVLSGTAADRDFMTVDASTGTIYLESGAGQLGTGSTLNPNAPNTGPAGRFVVASNDGVHWTTPQFLGAGISGPYISAANGVFATGGGSATPTLCGGAPACELFQTTTNAGMTWSQHVIPNSSDSSDGLLVAADPTTPGHFTVGYLNKLNTRLVVWQTRDYGNTWSGPTAVSDDSSFTKVLWKPWIAYSADGTLGLMWRTWHGSPNTSPYSVSAAISDDGGASFTTPLQVSDGNSAAPYPGLPPIRTFGDDFSFITFSKQAAFVAWADWRTNDPQGNPARQGFISIIKLQAFGHT